MKASYWDLYLMWLDHLNVHPTCIGSMSPLCSFRNKIMHQFKESHQSWKTMEYEKS